MTVNLLATMLLRNPSCVSGWGTKKYLVLNHRSSHRAHIRLVAAKSLLKIAAKESLTTFVSPKDFTKLSLAIQDPIFRVRQIFVEKLCFMFRLKSLPIHYIALLPLIAHEPEAELKNMATRFLRLTAKQLRWGTLQFFSL